jgi:hypothetical protein
MRLVAWLKDRIRALSGLPAEARNRLDHVSAMVSENRAVLEQTTRQLARVEKQADEVRTSIDELDRRLKSRSSEHKATMAELTRMGRDVAALQRRALLDLDDTPYPERLTLQRFGLLSQNEEDGVLHALLRATGIGSRRSVELGCGTNGGSTGFLVDELGFSGLMIDGGEAEVTTVRHRFPPSRVTAAQAWVERETVNELVTEHGFAGEIDVLSIDIDGNDLWVWEALTAARPRIAIVEYNALLGADRAVSVPYDREFRRTPQGEDAGLYYGASLPGLTAVGRRKSMRLVAVDHRGVNAFFVRDGLAPEIPGCEPATAWRLIDKYRRSVAEGLDAYARFEELGLKLDDVG